jgi:hypothetical protein
MSTSIRTSDAPSLPERGAEEGYDRSVRWICLLLLLLEQRADASWWYTYSCSGACAPDRLAVTDTIGPFGTQEDCDRVRGSDSRRYTNEQSGSLGGLTLCSESDAAPAGSSSSGSHAVAPTQSFALGMVAGPGYMREGDTTSTASYLGGVDAAVTIGARPGFGLVLRSGLRYTQIPVPMTEMTETAVFVPLAIGMTIAPGNAHLRAELGGDLGFDIAASCASCSGGALYYSLRGGFVVYGKHKTGVGVELVKDYHQGDGVVAGAMLVRLSLRLRNEQLSW